MNDHIAVNPKTDCANLSPNETVGFVPMANVQEKNNVVTYDAVPYNKVKTGFTAFQRGDLIWAKITPCMQNGKSCIVDKLPTAIGFGSTEFHVIRKRNNNIYMPFIWAIFSNENVLKAAQATFSGSAGQQRVSASFIERFPAVIPDYPTQVRLVAELEAKLQLLNSKLQQADELVEQAKKSVFAATGVKLRDYKPSLFSNTTRKQIQELGIFCNPHSAYLSELLSDLKKNPLYAGLLEDYIDVNPTIDRRDLSDKTRVSFVPMPNVQGKENHADYTPCDYSEVKTGFTAFQKDDLLWAKITPCMQNGKSFIASDMPTQYGFGSTEFHVLRAKNNRVYMPYIWVLLSEDHILEAAQGMFCGSAGQQRVPDTFLKKLPLVLPEYGKQVELANSVLEAQKRAHQMRREAEQEWAAAKAQFEKELLGE